MTITAQSVQKLRQETGSGMMDAKRALEEAAGDFERAREILREKGLAAAAKRSGRTQNEGSIGAYLHMQADRPVIGVLVELAAETDFVAKGEEFLQVANDLAMHVAWAKPRYVTRDEVPEDVVAKERELFAAQARNEGKPDQVIDKIVDGKLEKFYEDVVLYDQKFANTERYEGKVGTWMQELTARLGENIGVARFTRIEVGEER